METRFASTIVMLQKFKAIKRNFIELVVSKDWSPYKGDNLGRAQFVKRRFLMMNGGKT